MRLDSLRATEVARKRVWVRGAAGNLSFDRSVLADRSPPRANQATILLLILDLSQVPLGFGDAVLEILIGTER